MKKTRRGFLALTGQLGLAAATLATGLFSRLAQAVDARPAFEATSFKEALASIGVTEHKASAEIILKAPDIAENGAVVPVEVTSKLPGTRSIALLVEKNPHQMSAEFMIPEGTEAFVSTRLKVAETSDVYAVVKTDAGVFHAAKVVKVTLGGCGG
ncbi:MAG: thiosulfate oxidation carrier protein SoxY [Gammaproteobacteria bacterium]|nr:thiosulfate oxidation carrier protein SoxY [Gammaproteobacteria bacterium]